MEVQVSFSIRSRGRLARTENLVKKVLIYHEALNPRQTMKVQTDQ